MYAAGTVINGVNGTVVYPLAKFVQLASITYISLGVLAMLVLMYPFYYHTRASIDESLTDVDLIERPARKPRWRRAH